MRYTQGKWIADGTTVYCLNARGTNRFNLSVQPGENETGGRISPDELEINARLIAASPRMIEFIQNQAKQGDKEALEFITSSPTARGLTRCSVFNTRHDPAPALDDDMKWNGWCPSNYPPKGGIGRERRRHNGNREEHQIQGEHQPGHEGPNVL